MYGSLPKHDTDQVCFFGPLKSTLITPVLHPEFPLVHHFKSLLPHAGKACSKGF